MKNHKRNLKKEQNKKYNNIFLFKSLFIILIFIISTPLINAQPTQSQSFAGTQNNPYVLEDGEALFLNLNNYFSNYEVVELGFFDPDDNQAKFLSENINDFKSSIYLGNDFDVGLYSFGDVIDLQIGNDGVNTEFTFEISLYLIDSQGNGISDSFYITLLEPETQSEPDDPPINDPDPINPPTQTQSFVNQDLGFDDFLYLNFDNYYDEYDEVTITFTDPDDTSQSQVLIQEKGGLTTKEYVGVNFDVYLDSFSDLVALDFISKQAERTVTIDVSASNEGGTTSTSSFDVNIIDDTPPPSNGDVDFTILNNDLISYYNFDENTGSVTGDSKGTNDGTISGATWTTGKINSGLDFAGTSSNRVNTNYAMDIDGSYSVNMWVYPTESPDNDILADLTAATGNSWYLIRRSDSNKFSLQYSANSDAEFASTGIDLTMDAWQMITLTKSGTTVKLYVDNIEKATDTINFPAGSGNIFIGNRDEANLNLGGKADEVGIFNRALTSDEIDFLYATGSPDSDQQHVFEDSTTEPEPEPDPVGIPTFTQSLNPVLALNSFETISLNDVISEYDEVTLDLYSDSERTNLLKSMNVNKGSATTTEDGGVFQYDTTTTNSYTDTDVTISLIGTSNNILLDIISENNIISKYAVLTATNTEGNAEQNFTISIEDLAVDDNRPSITQNIEDLTSNAFIQLDYELQDYISNVDTYSVAIKYLNEQYVVLNDETINNDDIDIQIVNNVLSFIPKKEGEIEIIIRGTNSFGVQDTNTGILTIDPKIKSFIEIAFESITGLFPDEEELNTTQKLGYVVVTMFILTLIVGLGVTQLSTGLNNGGLLILGLINIMSFLYFIAIGYISISVLITLVILSLGLIYTKSMYNNGGV